MQINHKIVTLVGGGLVGSLLAIFLAKRGYEVEILERRPDPRLEKKHSGRSINLALSRRGFSALHQVGLEQDIMELAIPMYGRMVHSRSHDPFFQRYGKDDSEYISSISRSDLNHLLINRAEETGLVKIYFQQKNN
jgi:kynurenine 3-monooxygenase